MCATRGEETEQVLASTQEEKMIRKWMNGKRSDTRSLQSLANVHAFVFTDVTGNWCEWRVRWRKWDQSWGEHSNEATVQDKMWIGLLFEIIMSRLHSCGWKDQDGSLSVFCILWTLDHDVYMNISFIRFVFIHLKKYNLHLHIVFSRRLALCTDALSCWNWFEPVRRHYVVVDFIQWCVSKFVTTL